MSTIMSDEQVAVPPEGPLAPLGSNAAHVSVGAPKRHGVNSDVEWTTIVGVFEERLDAQQAIDMLRRAGFDEHEIGVAVRDVAEVIREQDEPVNHTADDAVAGSITGASVGGLWALGIAAGMLPGVGPAIAGSVLASFIASAAAGAAAGTLLGALVHLGIPEHEARDWEDEYHAGRTIVTVTSPGRHDEAARIIREYGGKLRTAMGQLE